MQDVEYWQAICGEYANFQSNEAPNIDFKNLPGYQDSFVALDHHPEVLEPHDALLSLYCSFSALT